MGNYASTSDVQARLPGRTLSVSSKPTLAQVSDWIDEAEALIDGALAGYTSLTVPVTSPARALKILKSWALLYAEGHTRMAFASGGGDGTNDDGKDSVAQFEAKLEWIRQNPVAAESALTSGAAASSTRRLRGHVLDNADGKTVSNGDFAPTFTRDDGEDQF
jgi:hypothetical protein